MNTKQPRSEGVRRIVLACSIVLVALWGIWALSTVAERVLRDNKLIYSLVLAVASGTVLFFIPKTIPDLLACIKDGFGLNKNR